MAISSIRVSFPAFVLSIFIALVLSLGWFPVNWLIWKPEWLALVLCYWMLRSPQDIGIFTAFLCGLLLDVLEGALLGQNALAFSTMAFLLLGSHQRFRLYSLIQQAFLLFFILGIVQMMIHVIKALSGSGMPGFSHLISAATSALAWPFVIVLMDKLAVRLR